MKKKSLVWLGTRLVLCLFGMFAAPYLLTWLYINYISPDIHDQSIRAESVILAGLVVGLGSFLALVGGAVHKGPHSNVTVILSVVAGFIYLPLLLCALVFLLLPYLVPDL